jgi:hypothetical protein
MTTTEPRPQTAPEITSLTEQVARCRRLAADVGDDITRAKLLELAFNYEAEVAEMVATL